MSETLGSSNNDCSDICMPSPEGSNILTEAKELSEDAYKIVKRAKDLGKRVSEMNENNCLFILKGLNEGNSLFACKDVNIDRTKVADGELHTENFSDRKTDKLLANDSLVINSTGELNKGSLISNNLTLYIKDESITKSKSSKQNSENKAELIRQANNSSKELDIALQCAEGIAKKTADVADNLKELISFAETLKLSSNIVDTTKDVLKSTKSVASMLREEKLTKELPLTYSQNMKAKKTREGEHEIFIEGNQFENKREDSTKYTPTKIFTNAAMHAGVFTSTFRNKMNHLQEYKRIIAFTSAGLSLGCLIGYFVGKIRRYQPLLEETAKIVKTNDDNNEQPYYKGMKLYYPVIGRKRRNSL